MKKKSPPKTAAKLEEEANQKLTLALIRSQVNMAAHRMLLGERTVLKLKELLDRAVAAKSKNYEEWLGLRIHELELTEGLDKTEWKWDTKTADGKISMTIMQEMP